MDNRFVPFNPRAHLKVTRRDLPHWTQPECTYFVTFRCADSIPRSELKIFEQEKTRLLAGLNHNRSKGKRSLLNQMKKYHHLLEEYLHCGYGDCLLRKPAIAKILEECLRRDDSSSYVLDKFVIQPNHAHTLVKPLEPCSLRDIVHRWKSLSSSRINELVGRKGQFWMHESFDHIVRSWLDLERFRAYIQQNPVKAGLGPGEFLLGQGSGLIR